MHAPDLFGSLLAVLMVASVFFWGWMLVDCLNHPAIQGKQKLVWVLAIVLFNIFGAIPYFIVARSIPSNEA
jgi:phage shock protein PspC (stress-responsive transcriptional regulator)